MKLTSKGRLAVTSLVDMAINSTGNRPISLSEISRRQNISINFLEQIFSSLKKKGIVKSIRGPLGGYIFAKDPSFIMIYDVINATDEDNINSELLKNNIDAIIDDTDENFSSKIKKMNLIGTPYQIIIGKKSEGDLLEFKETGGETQNLSLNKIIEIINKQKNSI